MAKMTETASLWAHIEKLVLAACLVVLMVCVLWGVIAAPKINLGDGDVPAGEVNKRILDAANSLRAGKPQENTEPTEDLGTAMSKLLNPQYPPLREIATPGQGPVSAPPTGPTVKVKLAGLERVIPAPGKPLVKVAPELRETLPQPTDVTASHVAAVYPYGKLSTEWKEALEGSALSATIVILGVEAEVEEWQPEGTWTEPRSVSEVYKPIVDSKGQEAKPPEIPDYDGKNAEAIHAAIAQYRAESTSGQTVQGWDLYQAEPDYWNVLGANRAFVSWRINLPHTEVSDLAPGEGESGGTHWTPPTPPPDYRGVDRPTRDPRGNIIPPGGIIGTPPPRGTPAPPSTPPPDRRTPTTPPPRPPTETPTTGPGVQMPTPVPGWATQMAAGKVLFWFHDTSLESLRAYRYRTRLVLLNPLLAASENEGVDAADARPSRVYTPWSPWSDRVSVPQNTEMFLTGSTEQLDLVTITVYARSLGQRVKQDFSVSPGQRIGHKVTVELVDPKTAQKISRDVDFSTGCTLVSAEWRRPVMVGGVKDQTTEIVYQDDTGRLQSRNMALDKSSSRYRELDAEVGQVKPIIEPTKPPPTPPPSKGTPTGSKPPPKMPKR